VSSVSSEAMDTSEPQELAPDTTAPDTTAAPETAAPEEASAPAPAADGVAIEAPDGAEDEIPEPDDNDGRGLPDFRRRKKEPRTFEEKLRAYKKQSQERLLDLKRSREAKIGGKKGRR